MKRPYIVYSLSKDRTTLKFNKNKVSDILKDIEIFFDVCTTTNINESGDLGLTAYEAYDSTDPKELIDNIINKTTKQFGSSDDFHWSFSKDKLHEIIQYIVENRPMPKANFGPLELFISYSFKLTDTVTRHELPNQIYSSIFCIWFSRTQYCSPTIFFPFEHADTNFWTYLDNIVPFLPFKLEEKYLRIAHVNKQGEVKSFKKIARALTS